MGNAFSQWCVRLLVVVVCGAWAGVCLAQDAGQPADTSGTPKIAGQVGGPCLADNSCTDGSRCFKLNDQPVCLFQPSAPGQNCPPRRQFVQCDPNGNNCRVICFELRGFGCEMLPHEPPVGWVGFCSLLLFGLLALRLRRGRLALRRKDPCDPT